MYGKGTREGIEKRKAAFCKGNDKRFKTGVLKKFSKEIRYVSNKIEIVTSLRIH